MILIPQDSRQPRRRKLRGIHIPLHFTQCNGRLGNSSVIMKDRIVGVLPALLHQAFMRVAAVFHEAVAVHIAIFIDPFQRPFDVWPQSFQELAIPGAIEISSRQHDKQRSGIDATVIAPEWHLA